MPPNRNYISIIGGKDMKSVEVKRGPAEVKVIIIDGGRDRDISDWIPETTKKSILEAYKEYCNDKKAGSWY
jgi:L-lactate utilization protein LutB